MQNVKDQSAVELVEREHAAVMKTQKTVTALCRDVESHLQAAVVAALKIKEALEEEPVLEKLNRRDVPGVTIRNSKVLFPGFVEYLQWKLELRVPSDFKLFQPGRHFWELASQDTTVLEREANHLKGLALRGW